MIEDEGRVIAPASRAAANDGGAAEARIESVVLTIARLLGRQIAREAFEHLDAANDDTPTTRPARTGDLTG